MQRLEIIKAQREREREKGNCFELMNLLFFEYWLAKLKLNLMKRQDKKDKEKN